ncbi:H/ACA ribonucleoprotein complex non-core subunit NAF1-like [Diospyros lotus]|uniref:H/ACA ribonucleoprotein complex non-core subunit NAF1-like n=1 Tax=Diospyros lotus TaxID=55363 RepID=UPI00224D7E3D|nr:H/ACA ribonucleoprotein complex non-core subunit NAF1-like [Diospyros lotus]
MVGVLGDPTVEEEDLSQQAPKLKNSDDSFPRGHSVSDLDDFSLSFVDSFLDFDSIRDWTEENSVLDMADLKSDQDNAASVMMEGLTGKPGVDVAGPKIEQENGGYRNPKLDELGCSIEEEIRKVCLDGSAGADASEPKSDGVGAVNDQTDGVKNGEAASVDGSGLKSSETLVARESVRNGGEKSDETESDGDDESDSSSGSESESSSSSSSSSSGEEEEDQEDEAVNELEGEMDLEEGEIRESDVEKMVPWSDNEDEEDDGAPKGPVRSKNELKFLPPVPTVNVSLLPHHQTVPVGVVSSVIGPQVIVEGLEKHKPLNEGSILWITESRSPLGLVDEIFGPVKYPYYIARYNSENEVPAGVRQGTSISFVPEFANHVLNDRNLYMKGYDASGEHDEELSDELEFSDDEKEAEYRRMLKMSKRGTNDPKLATKKKGRKTFKNRGGTWQSGRPSTPQTEEGVYELPPNQHRESNSPLAGSVDHGNRSNSFGMGQSFAGAPGLVPQFPQLVQVPGFIPPPSEVWAKGMPFEQQQSMAFGNGLPTNGMPWLQQNHHQQSYQMSLPNGMPIQQQFVPSQGLPSNVLMGGPSAFCAGPVFPPWSGGLGQNINPPLGMGMQFQPAPMSIMNMGEQQPPLISGNMEASQTFNHGMRTGNVGEQQRPLFSGNLEAHPKFDQTMHQGHGIYTVNVGEQPSPLISGNLEAPQKFNPGMHRGRGRRPYNRGGGRGRGRGGGRFGGGSGRQQS